MNGDTLLSGYRVLDLTDERGLTCGKVLGDLGADVIQIEPPGGSSARNIGPFYKDIPDPEKSLCWFWTAMHKRGVTLNLDSADGREIFKKLAMTADFVIESFEPGYMKSLGLDYEALEKINPRIIMTSITPFGQTGPYAHYKVSDIVGVSLGGMSRIYGEVDRPARISSPQFYIQGGLQGALGSVVAHYHREMTSEGQYVDVSCQQAIVLTLMNTAEMWDVQRMNVTGAGPGAGFMGKMVLKLIYRCRDGYVLTVVYGGAQSGFVTSTNALVEMANLEGYLLDLKEFDWTKYDFAPAAMARVFGVETEDTKVVDAFVAGLDEFLPTKSKEELFEEAVQNAIFLIPVCEPKDVVENRQLAAREFWVEVEHPELGETLTYPGYCTKMGGLPPFKPQRRAPLIGEHNEDIYHRELGLSKKEMVLLKANGAI